MKWNKGYIKKKKLFKNGNEIAIMIIVRKIKKSVELG